MQCSSRMDALTRSPHTADFQAFILQVSPSGRHDVSKAFEACETQKEQVFGNLKKEPKNPPVPCCGKKPVAKKVHTTEDLGLIAWRSRSPRCPEVCFLSYSEVRSYLEGDLPSPPVDAIVGRRALLRSDNRRNDLHPLCRLLQDSLLACSLVAKPLRMIPALNL